MCIKQNTGKKAVEDAASTTDLSQKEQTHSVKVDEVVEEAKHLHIEPDPEEEDHSPDDVR